MDLFGYIDPGTGSVFIQAVIGTVLASVFFLRNHVRLFFYRVKRIVTRSKGKSEGKAADDAQDDKTK